MPLKMGEDDMHLVFITQIRVIQNSQGNFLDATNPALCPRYSS